MMQSPDFEIVRTDGLVPSAELTRLFTELNGRETKPDICRINSLIAAGTLAFYIIRIDSRTVGMASVIPCRTAANDKLWIEDVCILEGYRGLGLGKALLRAAISDAEKYFGKGTFWLTSRPSRKAARAMYRELGFVEHDTGVFYLRKNCGEDVDKTPPKGPENDEKSGIISG